MMQIHPQARTTPAVRAEIARSTEPASIVAKRYGISDETVRKWRKRGEHACQDRSSRPRRLPWRASEEERAIICAVRRATGFPLDDLTFVLRHFLPHLNRDSIYRVLKSEGLNRRPPKPTSVPVKGQGRFKDYDLGFVHIDVKHLPKLRTADGQTRKRFLYVAIDRCSRFVFLAVYDAENAANAVDFLTKARKAFPFRITDAKNLTPDHVGAGLLPSRTTFYSHPIACQVQLHAAGNPIEHIYFPEDGIISIVAVTLDRTSCEVACSDVKVCRRLPPCLEPTTRRMKPMCR